jgi:hypothetical protein
MEPKPVTTLIKPPQMFHRMLIGSLRVARALLPLSLAVLQKDRFKSRAKVCELFITY